MLMAAYANKMMRTTREHSLADLLTARQAIIDEIKRSSDVGLDGILAEIQEELNKRKVRGNNNEAKNGKR